MHRALRCFSLVGLAFVGACSCSGTAHRTPSLPSPTVAQPTYEVHEWGLVRGTADDQVMVSGPHAEPEPVPVAKPVLYFHRAGEGALVVNVDARVAGGRIVEHWPSLGAEAGDVAAWQHVLVQAGACRGSRYPGPGVEPCARLRDGCEAATLATVETTDADCLSWPEPPGGDGPTESWNHLFYRGEVSGAPTLPLRIAPLADGTLRVTSTGTDAIPGRLVRVRRANGVAGATDAAEVAAPPLPGATVVVAAPRAPLADGVAALEATLRAAGLTTPEVAAFRRAWDAPLFGGAAADMPVTVTPPFAAPLPAPTVTTSLVYVMPLRAADALAPLHFEPAPTAVRRAMVVWIEER